MAPSVEVEEGKALVDSSVVEVDVQAPGDLPGGFEFVCKLQGKLHTIKVVSEEVA